MNRGGIALILDTIIKVAAGLEVLLLIIDRFELIPPLK